MKIVKADIWKYYEQGWHVIIPTNGYVNKLGECVMKRGLSYQAKKLFGKLSIALGNLINQHGNHVYLFERQRLITFPTKHSWRDPYSDLKLIETSCKELGLVLKQFPNLKIAMPKVGCGAGKLEWDDVAYTINEIFGSLSEDRFCIVDNEQGDASQDFRGDNTENIRGLNAKEDEQIIDLPAPEQK